MKIRRKIIVDLVERYKQNNYAEYALFCMQLQDRREALNDKNFGKTKDDGELRAAASFPTKLWNMIEYVFANEDKRFGEDKGEMAWFLKKYPEFLIPSKY